MATKRSEEFKREAVRIAQTSGLTRKRVAADLGVGLSSLNKWLRCYGEAATSPTTVNTHDLAQENERLRRELRLVTEEREVLKKATIFFAGQKR